MNSCEFIHMNPVAAATVPLPRSQDVSGDSDSAEMGSGWATTGPAGPASPGRFPAIQNSSKGTRSWSSRHVTIQLHGRQALSDVSSYPV